MWLHLLMHEFHCELVAECEREQSDATLVLDAVRVIEGRMQLPPIGGNTD